MELVGMRERSPAYFAPRSTCSINTVTRDVVVLYNIRLRYVDCEWL